MYIPEAAASVLRSFEDSVLCCPHLAFPFLIVERSGRVPSAHESGYCIIFCQRLISSPTESSSTSSFSIIIVPAEVKITQRKQN